MGPETRSHMMSRIGGKNTKPELLIRSGLHRRGYRYRLHDRTLPGRPDIVLAQWRTIIEVRGCFWHGHDCHLFRWPETRAQFWRDKIKANVQRDEKNRAAILGMGWRLAEVWECQLKGRMRRPLADVLDELSRFIEGANERCVVGPDKTVL
ncbi:very short patch repair endonuclease [Parerythrobacter jejuensis]|uniref:very short patch repair endonuclease n=1 Tax=Parerythrobacter jejuensis TaxID=795812 RepID=UPI002D802E83|nr:very short patch repair endonuclease [Parerythrobacter jejuensis]